MAKADHSQQSRARGKVSGSARTTANLVRLKDRRKLDLIMDAVSSLELSETEAWSDLDCLSTHTIVEDIEAVPEGIFQSGDIDFAAVATVYVALNYGDKGDDISSVDSFPAQVEGHFDPKGNAVIDRVRVDTSAFYE
jgi:hypothetical protein